MFIESITMKGREPFPRFVHIGMKGEHNAEKLVFHGLPVFDPSQAVVFNLMLPDGTADIIDIVEGEVTITRNHTPQPGTLTGWVAITVNDDLVWKSEIIRLIINTVPDISAHIERQYPTALEDAISKTAANKADAEAAQDKAEDAQEAAEDARDQVLGMSVTAETLPEGSEATVHYEGGVMAFGIPKGDTGTEGRQGEPGRDGAPGKDGQDGAPGQDGVSPVISVSEITGGHRVTATDAQGDHTFDVMDGAKGDPGDPTELIDDTAGTGDTDKVWSADKSAGEVSDLLSALNVMNPAATASDVGKALLVKTVEDGKPTSWEYGEAGGGTSDYDDLTDKPQINGVTLSGNKTSADLSIPTTADIETAVDAWLDENITNPDSPPLDRSLSSDSAAAPADIVGKHDDVLANTIEVTSRTPTLAFTSKKTWIVSNGVATLTDNSTTNYRASNACAVLPGDEVKLTFQPCNHGVNAKAILVTDAEYNILLTIDAPSSGLPVVSHEFVVPAAGAYFMLNQWAGTQPSNFTITTTTKYSVALQKDLDAADSRIESLESFDADMVTDTSATNNLMDYRPFAEGTISDQTGVFTPVVTPATYKYICSGFIPVETGVTYNIRRTNGGDVSTACQGYYYYASDKTYISGQTGDNSHYWSRWTIPNGVRYMRVFMYIGQGAQSFDSIPEYAKTWGLFEYGTDNTKPLFVPLTTIAPERRVDFTVDTRAFAGKTIAVLGDSIGTRQGYNDPEVLIGEADVGVQLSAYLTNNDVDAGLSIAGHTYTSDEIGTEVTFTPTAGDVGKSIGVPLNHGAANDIRWWQMLCVKLGMTATNASWSGATMVSEESIVTTTYKASCAWYESTIRRCGFRTPGTMTRVAPDYIFIHRGVNDFSNTHSGRKTVLTDGVFSAYNYAIPETDQIMVDGVTMYDFKQAYAMTIQKLRDAYPTAKIICCTIAPFRRHNETHFPPNNGRYNLPSFNKAIREVAEFFGCPVCEFAEAYKYEELSTFTGDNTHPNEYGHRSMYERALLCLVNNAKVDC